MDAENRRKYNQTSYISGNTARKLNAVPQRDYGAYQRPQPQVVTPPERRTKQQPEARPARQPHVGRGIDFFSMVLLCGAMAITLYVCFNYLQAQSNAIQLDKQITVLENQVNDLTDKNDAMEMSINKPVDLDEVYRIAVGELGMVHPNNNAVITYDANDSGYVRQYDDIPSAN
ncbi:MAG: septum formation initiator family protein [Clostridiales bacterium]|nr:septum formation initiator family protein [Clostridiales bacterium]